MCVSKTKRGKGGVKEVESTWTSLVRKWQGVKDSEFVIRKQNKTRTKHKSSGSETTTKNSALTCLHRTEVQHVTCASASKSHPSGYHQRSLKSGGALLLQKREGETAQKNPPKSSTERCAGPISPDNRQGQEWQTRPNPWLGVRLISKSKSLEKVIPEWEDRGGVSVWVPCMALLEGDASEAGATFCTRDSVKVNLRSVFGEGGG